MGPRPIFGVCKKGLMPRTVLSIKTSINTTICYFLPIKIPIKKKKKGNNLLSNLIYSQIWLIPLVDDSPQNRRKKKDPPWLQLFFHHTFFPSYNGAFTLDDKVSVK